jgi:hypothetical protein
VKRIAAVGDEVDARWIDLRHGDVWLGPDAQNLVREQKEPLAARGLRVTWASWPGSPDAQAPLAFGAATAGSEGGLLLRTAGDSVADAKAAIRAAGSRRQFRLPEGFVGTREAIDAGCIDIDGRRGRAGADVPVTDVGVDLAIDELVGELVASIDLRGEALTFWWRPGAGQLQLWRDGDEVAACQLPANAAPRRVEFGLLDDRLFFVVDGDPTQQWLLARPAAERSGGRAPRAHVHFAAIGVGASLRLGSLRVFHDVFAWREPIVGREAGDTGWPRYVAPGQWFLLGDSAFDSRDSRQFGAVPVASFLGVPRCVLGPWGRRRWVAP